MDRCRRTGVRPVVQPEKGRLQCGPLPVELPGIGPDTEFVSLSCGNIGFRNAKARETTRRDLLIHRRVLMASTAPSRPFERAKSVLKRRRECVPVRAAGRRWARWTYRSTVPGALAGRRDSELAQPGVVGLDAGQFDVLIAPHHVRRACHFHCPVVIGRVQLGSEPRDDIDVLGEQAALDPPDVRVAERVELVPRSRFPLARMRRATWLRGPRADFLPPPHRPQHGWVELVGQVLAGRDLDFTYERN